jgi:SEFIR domain
VSEEAVKVFISYSWDSDEHKEKVLKLSNTLRDHGVDCQIDRYHQSPSEGWYRWMMAQIENSNFVLVVCTEKYHLRYDNQEEQGRGRGVTWEGGLIIADLYAGQGINEKFIPVLFSPGGEKHIPKSLQPYTVYSLFNCEYNLNIKGAYQDLYRHLTKQPAYIAPQLGKPQILPPVHNAPSNIGSDGELIQTEDLRITKEQAEQKQIQLDQGIGKLVDSLQDTLDPQLRSALAWLSDSKERASTLGKAALKKHPEVQAELLKDFKKAKRFEKELETCLYRLRFALFTDNFVPINEARITFDSRVYQTALDLVLSRVPTESEAVKKQFQTYIEHFKKRLEAV